MGVCISTAKFCVKTGEDAVDEFLDRQSRYYKESKLAKEQLDKQNASNNNGSHMNAILQSDLSPIYPSLPNSAKKYHCHSVYDGDTLTLVDGGTKVKVKVRLLGIDTPEIKEQHPFALEAKEYTKKYCQGKDIWLTLEESEGNDKNKDRYGRLLAYIWVPLSSSNNTVGIKVGGKGQQQSSAEEEQWLNINESLIASGLAHAYSPSKSKKVHNHDKLLALQKLARVHKCGQWASYKDYNAISTQNGSAFHKCKKRNSTGSACAYLARSKNLSLIAASEAYDKGLHPCRACFG